MGQERRSEERGQEASSDSGIRPRQFGRYALIKKLATGGMAEIWLASQRGVAGFTRLVVIKKILAHLGEQESFVQMFLDEARTCSQLSHPNVVQIYDLGQEGSSYFIAMEYIAGENLAAIAWRGIKRQQPLSPLFAAKMICDAAKALHYAHTMRGPNGRPLEIVHRDISPQNVLVTYEGEVKVVDFGIAKAASKSEHTKTGMLKGKFSYMSPEQCLGAPLDGRSDVFALGIVLYELCTGKRLFKHESELMILDMITKREVVPPSQAVAGIPAALDAIIMRALEKALERRFQTAQEMQLALESLLRAEPRIIGSTDLAAYMQALFDDRIEEKRRLCEAAARSDIVAAAAIEAAEEPPAQHSPARNTARRGLAQSLPGAPIGEPALPGAGGRGGSPGGAVTADPFRSTQATTRARAPARTVAGSFAPVPPLGVPSTQPPATEYGPATSATPMPMVGATAYVGYTGLIKQPKRNWVIPSVVLIGSVAAMILAVALNRMSEPVPVAVTQGRITVASRPAGARVFFDGQPMLDEQGRPRVTPVTIDKLDYGASHQVRVEQKDHRPAERAFVMGESLDKQEIALQLEPMRGTLIATVSGDDADKIEVYVGSERAGIGPTLRFERAPGRVMVSGRGVGRACTASPEAVELRAGSTEVVTITCKRPRPSGGREGIANASTGAGSAAKTEGGAANEAVNAREAADGACVANPNAPPGYATINSTPYADIYLNGKLLGQTPIPKKQLPAGCVIIRAVNPESNKERTLRLEIAPGAVQIFNFEL